MKDAIDREGAVLNVVAPMVGGVEASDGSSIEAVEKIHGGPSFVFDAVAILLSAEGAALLGDEASARDFVADAIVHCKFIAHKAAAMPLLQKAGVAKAIDRGVVPLKEPTDAESFIETCRQLRLWEREAQVKRI